MPLDCLAFSDIDPSQWGFQGKEAYERRVYFWNLMAGVLWQVRDVCHHLSFLPLTRRIRAW